MSHYEFNLPDLGEGTVSSEIVQWRVEVGQRLVENAPLVELATEKAVVEVTAPVAGRILSLNGKPGDHIPVGAVLVVFDTDAATPAEETTSGDAATAPTATPPRATASVASPAAELSAQRGRGGAAHRVMTSPAIRRLAREARIDLTQVVGTGPQGRIERRDIEALLNDAPQPAATPVDASVRRIPVVGVRRVIAERMVKAVHSIPHITYVEEVDLTRCEARRQALNAALPAGEAAYTLLPFVIEALTAVLKRHPRLNAHYDSKENLILEYDAVHVGIATHTPDGLKVPVLTHAERLTLPAIRDQLHTLAERARHNQSKRSELTGSTITITSLGKLGGIMSTPIINSPEVAIIGLNQAKPAVVVREGQMVIRLMMNLSASFDHRFVDGYDGALFIQDLKRELEAAPEAAPVASRA